ncbi:MAG: phosphoribosylglycinamide formyltransferase [Rhodospirillales bacterium]|nr:phosphoribosylglycinamide formyltransferase [Rhodospirillales bacterium]
MSRVPTAVLVSGRGSNLKALLEASRDPSYPAEITLAISNEPEAPAIDMAAEAGCEVALVPHRDQPSHCQFETLLQTHILESACQLVCLAGFMRVLSPAFVGLWAGRMLNIHPSLLPSFPGLDSHRRALEAGVRLSGCSVHFVTEELDGGPIIGQAAVPVAPDDDEASLAARVLAAEHRLYPVCLALVAEGKVRMEEGRIVWDAVASGDALLNPSA